MKTGPAAGAYPIGPEFPLHFEAAKKAGIGYFALLSAIVGVVCVVTGGFLKDHLEWAISLVALGTLLIVVAGVLWSGRVKLPGGK